MNFYSEEQLVWVKKADDLMTHYPSGALSWPSKGAKGQKKEEFQ